MLKFRIIDNPQMRIQTAPQYYFFLQNLGLKGNQLSLEISSIYNEPNGMRKLLDYMLDNMSGKTKCFILFLREKLTCKQLYYILHLHQINLHLQIWYLIFQEKLLFLYTKYRLKRHPDIYFDSIVHIQQNAKVFKHNINTLLTCSLNSLSLCNPFYIL